MQFQETAALHTERGIHPVHLCIARGFWGRLLGLMSTPALQTTPVPQALLLLRCPSLHGFFMRYAIDVVYLHGESSPSTCSGTEFRFQVTHIAHLKPWRISVGRRWNTEGTPSTPLLRSQHALEMPAGSAAALGIARGDWLSWKAAPGDRGHRA